METINYFDEYFTYTVDTEPPKIYHRWCAISGISAILGRNFWFSHGHFKLYPNQYIMLIGEAGSRKSTAIKLMKNIVRETGYDNIAADKTTKEKFLIDLQDGLYSDEAPDEVPWETELYTTEPREVFITADEFNEFAGTGNIDFLSLLGTLWDYEGIFRARVKNSKSVAIYNPTVNILAGNTSDRLVSAIPVEIIGQGFLSRIILVFGKRTEVRIPFPRTPDPEQKNRIIDLLQKIQINCRGEVSAENTAKEMLSKIYRLWESLPDPRFSSYSTRRFTHLLKLCLVCCAARLGNSIEKEDVVFANTILTYTENLMPRALGEFGKAKSSDVAHKIMEALDSTNEILSVIDLFRLVSTDVDKISDLSNILMNLEKAGKIQMAKTEKKQGFLARRYSPVGVNTEFLDWNLLTSEELGYV